MSKYIWEKQTLEDCKKCEMMNNKKTLFHDLSDISIQKISHDHSIVQKNEHIYRATDTKHYIYSIQSGIIGLAYINDEYKIRISEILVSPMVAGLESITTNSYMKDAIALTTISICRITLNKNNMQDLILSTNVINKWQEQYKKQIEVAEFTSGKTSNRLMRLFLFLAKHSFIQEKNTFYMISLKYISSIVNVSMENCSRSISLMKKNSTITKITASKFLINNKIS